ncbi:MAG: fibronectin type III domain-containing protein [Chthoniobacterales bacterium]
MFTSSINNGFFPRFSRKFANVPVAMLIAFLRNVIVMMTGNPAFLTPPPNPSLADVKTAVDDLEEKNQAALNGGKVEIANRRAAQEAAVNLGRQLGNYVESQSNGDLAVLLSSGFDAVRAPTPSVVPATPLNPTLNYTGVSGELLFRFLGDYNVRNFSVGYAESAAGPWTDNGLSTTSRVLLAGLTPGKTYWARACANGAAGTSDWCTPASIMAI